MIKKYIPKFVKNIIKKILYNKENRMVIRELKNSMGEKRLLLFLTPVHGNIGDQAITVCENQFLKDYFGTHIIIEISAACWRYERRKIARYIKKRDRLLVHGGGFLGTLWMEQGEETGFRKILKAFPDNKIIVFPQSVFFSDDEFGKEQLKISRQIYRHPSNLILCMRERNSYERVKDSQLIGDMNRCFLMPDIVTYYKGDLSNDERTDNVLLCFRNDKEKIRDENLQNEIVHILVETGLKFSYTDTVVTYKVPQNKREEEVSKKLREFAQCKFVITDRLHGMLFAAITGTPCLFMDNCSHKVSGTYEWIKNLEYIKPLKNMDSLRDFIDQLKTGKVYPYDNKHLQPYYAKLAEIIKE